MEHSRADDGPTADRAVAVGSTNPVKLAATERALTGVRAVAADVDSGVAEQPVGHAETRRGARQRARRARAVVEDAVLGIGIEGGVARFPDAGEANDDATGERGELFLVMWAAATDGDRWGDGAGPALRLPAAVATRVTAGEELGPVMDDVLNEDGVSRGRGAAGALSAGTLNREAALAAAVAAACGPFASDHYGDAAATVTETVDERG